jgi:hypothetical protein
VDPVPLPRILPSLAALTAIAAADYVTGYEVSLDAFYLLPAAVGGWCIGRRGGCALAITAGIVWWAVDWASGHPYVHELARYWNALAIVLAASVTAAVLDRLHRLSNDARHFSDGVFADSSLNPTDETAAQVREARAQMRRPQP